MTRASRKGWFPLPYPWRAEADAASEAPPIAAREASPIAAPDESALAISLLPLGTPRALGYISLTESEQRLNRAALVSQEAIIREACASRRWPIVAVICERDEAARQDERPGLASALERLEAGEASYLVVSGFDRLGRSIFDVGTVLRRLRELQATLLVLDSGIDTSRPDDALVTQALARLAERERENIGARTRTALAAARAEGRPISRPAVSDHPRLRERIETMRSDGMTLQRIADTLNAEGVPTLRGGAFWRPSSVQAAAGYRRPSAGGRPAEPSTT